MPLISESLNEYLITLFSLDGHMATVTRDVQTEAFFDG